MKMNYKGENFELWQDGKAYFIRMPYAFGVAGDEETAIKTAHRMIDHHLNPPTKTSWWKRLFK